MSTTMHTLFISDLHLSHETPEIAKNLLRLLNEHSNKLDALYILGDLFEYWLGDDGITPQHKPVLNGIKQIANDGVPVYFIRGNRDFLISNEFASQSGCNILEEPVVIDLYGTPSLIMHGDLLCTDDHAYMQFREQVRNPQWQAHFLSLNMPQRIQMAKQARDTSQSSTKEKSMEIMDANQSTVERYLQEFGVDTLIHGHTHRPGIHHFDLNGKKMKRIVLGDWKSDWGTGIETQASYLLVSPTNITLSDPRLTPA
ncbi:MAG: UDP-2,3-diacylglucosamine diphosphatase [Gammaproteobacteria bacterium]|nr:UDP-2,3-diacylglucosamine diphosphatase [Gammaproteobacteria bacterium]